MKEENLLGVVKKYAEALRNTKLEVTYDEFREASVEVAETYPIEQQRFVVVIGAKILTKLYAKKGLLDDTK